MAAYRRSVHANLEPVAAVFLWADLNRVTDWWPGVSRVSDVEVPAGQSPLLLGGPWPLVIEPGSRYTLWFGSRPVRHEVLRAERDGPTAYVTRLAGRFRRGETIVTFEPEGGGSRVTLEVRPSGLVPGIAARLQSINRSRGGYRGQLRAFEQLADRERWRHMTI